MYSTYLQIKLNHAKRKIMHFGENNDKELECAAAEEFLGIIVYRDLKFDNLIST